MKNKSIRTRIIVILIIFLTLLVSVMDVRFSLYNNIQEEQRQVLKNLMDEEQLSTETYDLVEVFFVATKDPKVYAEFNYEVNELEKLLERLETKIQSPDSVVLFKGVRNSVKNVIKECNDTLISGEIIGTSEKYLELLKKSDYIKETAAELILNELNYLNEISIKTDTTIEKYHAIGTVTSILLYIITILVIFFVISSFTKPIISIAEASKNISEGKLEHIDKSIRDRNDEIGILAESLDSMVSNLKEKIKEVEYLNKNLEKKVKIRTKDLENVNKKVIKLLNLKTQFINQVAHDLRTPLTPIKALLPIIRKNAKCKTFKQQLTVINNNVEYLSTLVSDTLNLSKLESGKSEFKFENISLKEIFDSAIKTNQIVIRENKIKIKNNIENNLIVNADKFRIVEVISNLIGNSVKFMPKKKLIEISAKKQCSFVKIIFKDSGIGIDKKHLKKIFEEFFKLDDSRHDAASSSGLGLSICNKIINAHDGKIWAESKGKNQGTSIIFTLPNQKK